MIMVIVVLISLVALMEAGGVVSPNYSTIDEFGQWIDEFFAIRSRQVMPSMGVPTHSLHKFRESKSAAPPASTANARS
jgi:hypothetical protein